MLGLGRTGEQKELSAAFGADGRMRRMCVEDREEVTKQEESSISAVRRIRSQGLCLLRLQCCLIRGHQLDTKSCTLTLQCQMKAQRCSRKRIFLQAYPLSPLSANLNSDKALSSDLPQTSNRYLRRTVSPEISAGPPRVILNPVTLWPFRLQARARSAGRLFEGRRKS